MYCAAFKMVVGKYLKCLLLFFIAFSVNCDRLKESACIYDTPGGKVDLSPLVSDNGTARFSVVDENDEYEYLWNPCVAFSDNYCQNAAVCQITLGSQWHVLLATQDGVVRQNAGGPLELQLFGTDPNDQFTRSALITLICDPTQTGSFAFQAEEPIRVYHFTLTSKYACVILNPTTTSAPSPQTRILTTVAPPTPTPPIISLETITILLAAILVCLCVLNCMVFLGLITRSSRHKGDNSTVGFTNHAFEKKPLKY